MDRWLVSGVVLLGSFGALVSLSFLELTPLREVASDQDTIETLFSAFIGAIITGTAIVITINQLVLAQELGSAGDQHNRMRETMAFRRDVESALEIDVISPEPASFLCELLEGIEIRARELEEMMAGGPDDELRRGFTGYTTTVIDDARLVRNSLENAQFGTFEVISNALEFNYSRKIHRARQLREEHAASIDDEADEVIDELIESLTLFGPSREHFKTLYFQWELINLSRALLYIAIPALIAMSAFVMFVDGTTLPGRTLGVDHLVWLTCFGVTVGIAPFVVFAVYILRIVTVAKRTLAMGPVVLQETERGNDFE